MPRGSRHKSTRHGLKDARESSDSENDSTLRDRKGKESGSRVLKDSASSEKRRFDSKDSKEFYGSENLDTEEHGHSKRRKERYDEGTTDRWNGGSDDELGVPSKKSKPSVDSKSKRRDESVGLQGDGEELKKSSGKGEGRPIAGIDHEGFGRSDGRHGYFESMEHLVDDAIELIKLTREKYKGRKVFVHGGSLGGLMIVYLLLKVDKHLVDGAVILCPAIQIHQKTRPSPALEMTGKLLRALAPKLPIAPGNRGKNSSPEVAAMVDAMKRADPMFYNGKLRIGTGLAILDALQFVQDKLHLIDHPYLLQHGTADFVCHISGSEEFHGKTASKDKTFRAYPDGAHDLSNEPPHIRNAVVNDFVQWLEERTQ